MLYFITDECIGCGESESNCLSQAIIKKDNRKYEIDEELWIACDGCVGCCTAQAIITGDMAEKAKQEAKEKEEAEEFAKMEAKKLVILDTCVSWENCLRACTFNVIIYDDEKYKIDNDICISCRDYVNVCEVKAIVEKGSSEAADFLITKAKTVEKEVIDLKEKIEKTVEETLKQKQSQKL